jgi:putative transcriptional regulator
MSKRAFDKIKEGLEEAIAVARGEAKPARSHAPEEIDVRVIRRHLKLTRSTGRRKI